jgi:hypothetical protein
VAAASRRLRALARFRSSQFRRARHGCTRLSTRPFTKNDLAALVSLTGKNAGLVKRSLRGAEAAVT